MLKYRDCGVGLPEGLRTRLWSLVNERTCRLHFDPFDAEILPTLSLCGQPAGVKWLKIYHRSIVLSLFYPLDALTRSSACRESSVNDLYNAFVLSNIFSLQMFASAACDALTRAHAVVAQVRHQLTQSIGLLSDVRLCVIPRHGIRRCASLICSLAVTGRNVDVWVGRRRISHGTEDSGDATVLELAYRPQCHCFELLQKGTHSDAFERAVRATSECGRVW